ncbi:MAG: cation:proton antiporter [Pseudomonadota bacterium]
MLSQWFAWRVRLPAILFLLIAGVVVGPLAGLLDPDRLFGDLLFPVVSLAVAVILFEGAMTLKFSELVGIGSTVRNLVTLGALVTWLITAAGAWFFIGMAAELALLFGALVVVTGPTVIVPMLRTVRPNARVSNTLRWEGIVIDPLGALLAVLAYDFYISTESHTVLTSIALLFGEMLLIGVLLGLVAGFVLGELLRRYLIPDYLRSVFTLLLVFVVFVTAEVMQHESGLLAVTVFGITLANLPDLEIEDILDFKETLSVLLISGLFILLAARIDLNAIIAVGGGALLLLMTVMFVARPLAVAVSTLGSNLNWRERLLIAWIGPRGIVCAAVAALFSLRLEELGIPEAALFVPLAFLIIIGTVVIQSLTAKSLAHWLGVRDPAPTGVLIVGAGNVGRSLGKVLKEDCGLKVILVDSNYEHIRSARMDGLDTFYGSAVSEHADRNLDLSGIGKLMAMSGRADLDVLVEMNFRPVFGTRNLFELPTSAEGNVADKHRISRRYRGSRLFGDSVTYNKLAGWLRNGAEVRVTTLTDEFDFEAYQAQHGDRFILLFALDASGRLRIFTADAEIKPLEGWKVISLMLPRDLAGSAAGADNQGE